MDVCSAQAWLTGTSMALPVSHDQCGLSIEPLGATQPQKPSASTAPWCSRKTFNHLDHLVAPISLEATELDQLADALHHDTLLRSSCDSDSPASLKVEQSLVAEDVQSTQHRVLVDPENRRHIPGQWQALSRTSLAIGDGPANLSRHLIMERRCLGAVDLDIKHGTSHSRSMDPGLPGPA
jgi:hypothetical protein